VAHGNLCAGVVRYELAQLYDLTGRHVEALLLHAANREQYPRFYRGRYRLAMSLEMLANPDSGLDETDMTTLKEVLRILGRYCQTDEDADRIGDGQAGPPDGLASCLLAAAWQELHDIERYLTWRHIIWGAFWHRNERSVLGPYWQLRHRQAFHDGVRVAQLLVAVRQALTPAAKDVGSLRHANTIARITAAISGDRKDVAELQVAVGQALTPGPGDVGGSRDANTIARITAAISGDCKVFAKVLPAFPSKVMKGQPVPTRRRTRLWPWQCSTPSWPAARVVDPSGVRPVSISWCGKSSLS
jgi:hypothetical protein